MIKASEFSLFTDQEKQKIDSICSGIDRLLNDKHGICCLEVKNVPDSRIPRKVASLYNDAGWVTRVSSYRKNYYIVVCHSLYDEVRVKRDDVPDYSHSIEFDDPSSVVEVRSKKRSNASDSELGFRSIPSDRDDR